jgi:membrane-associated phospholipid phosphatase
MYGHKIGIPLYMYAGFVAFSRLSNNSHFLSDALFGAVLGTVVGRAVASIHKDKGNSKLSILPYSDGSGGGLMLTLSW